MGHISLCERCKFYSLEKIEVEERIVNQKFCAVLGEKRMIFGNLSECNFYKENLTKKE